MPTALDVLWYGRFCERRKLTSGLVEGSRKGLFGEPFDLPLDLRRSPAQFATHERGYARRARDAPVGGFGRDMNASDQYIRNPARELPTDRMNHLCSHSRMGRVYRITQPSVTADEVQDALGLGSVVPQQVLDVRGRQPEFESSPEEWVPYCAFPAW